MHLSAQTGLSIETAYADVETSSPDYARRFSGNAGEWLLDVQRRALFELIGASDARVSVLDVAGGHGQVARALCGTRSADFDVTVHGSDSSCSRQVEDLVSSGACSFVTGDPFALPLPDRSFDVVTCFRFMAHTPRWRELVGELCRVSRKAVIVDYASRLSLNFFYPLLFPLKRSLEGNTRPYLLFSPIDIESTFQESGFAHSGTVRQFCLPMVLHRKIGRPAISAALEGACRAGGLTALVGSPIVARFDLR